MLAKPEYSSPPNEVCCWQGRCGGVVAGREPSAQRTAGRGAAAKSHREDVAGRGTVAELLAGSAMAKRMAALWQRAIGKMLLAGAPWESCWQGRCGGAVAGREPSAQRTAGRGAVAELLAGRGTVAELLPAAAGRHYGTKKESDP